jgi:2-polyprenyl-3-methyl-5-hydroxy-6-metoxy-1,4-benzoquinol methylase
MTTESAPLDQQRTLDFLTRVMADGGSAFAGVSTSIGVRLGLYRALSGAGALSSEQLAERTGLVERYVREWLAAQVAGEYVHYDPQADTYLLPDEHGAVLADPASPFNATGSFTMLRALYAAEDALVQAFRTGEGVGWGDFGPELAEGTATFFRPGYAASLVSQWLPALDGIVEKLERGAKVADVGCGWGYSTLLMAEAFPRSRFVGFDFHAPSIARAQENAAGQGIGDRVRFEVAAADQFSGADYDLITFFDCLHDMGDPLSALRRARGALAEDGACMIVEPNTSGKPHENINPVGRGFASTSVVLCLPVAMAQKGPYALGNHSGEEALRAIAAEAGLSRWSLAVEGVANRVYDVRR